jgi:serine/threonine-protein kinase
LVCDRLEKSVSRSRHVRVDARAPPRENEVVEGVQYHSGQELPGTVYRVVRHLATGGMGSVYDVEDVTVGKRYVLKTLHPQLVGREDLTRRMREEARTLARLHHANIVDVVTAGVTQEARPTPFYVMERLNGNNLRLLLDKRGSLELQHCYEIGIDVADALEHAHENGVIHRDVKPENIFLHRNSNGTTTTKLLDFGIMRLLDRKQSHTQGKFIGTLRYASPEQIMGGELGPATDIYSLGIVIYEMLCGRGPFDDVGDAYAIGAAHAQMMPPPLSRFARVPPALEHLVMSTLGKTPAERPRDCFTLAAELRKMRREEDNAPRSVTAIAVLSSVPDTRATTAGALAGTEPAASTGQTQQGMIPPSAIGEALVAAPDDVAFAKTIASEPKAEPIRPGVDRNAATRASGGEGQTQRLAQHGTMMEMEERMAAADAEVRAALAEPAPLVVPPMYGAPPASGDMVFPRPSAISTVTGPLAGEARTRPPERGVLLPLLGIVALCSAIAGGAVLVVKKPWVKRETATAPQPPIVAPTPVVAPTPTQAVSAPPPAIESAKPAAPTPTASVRPAGHVPKKPSATPAPTDIPF